MPKRLEAGNYFAEQRQFNLSLQANGVNFDQFLAVRGQTVEQFRQWLHRQAERKLRSWLGLLLVAEREGLQPTEAEVNAALAHWNEKLDGGGAPSPPTTPARCASALPGQTVAFVVAHSTLTPRRPNPLYRNRKQNKNHVIYAMAGGLRAARHSFSKRQRHTRRCFRCPRYRVIPDDASGRTFLLTSTSRPTAGRQAQG